MAYPGLVAADQVPPGWPDGVHPPGSPGFERTAVLPVVPDFSHLDSEPNRFVANQFDDAWTNILFVGRVIPNNYYAVDIAERMKPPPAGAPCTGGAPGCDQGC